MFFIIILEVLSLLLDEASHIERNGGEFAIYNEMGENLP